MSYKYVLKGYSRDKLLQQVYRRLKPTKIWSKDLRESYWPSTVRKTLTSSNIVLREKLLRTGIIIVVIIVNYCKIFRQKSQINRSSRFVEGKKLLRIKKWNLFYYCAKNIGFKNKTYLVVKQIFGARQVFLNHTGRFIWLERASFWTYDIIYGKNTVCISYTVYC